MATVWLFVRNPLLFEVTFTFSFKTLRYFSSGRSPLCSSTRSLRPLMLNLSFLKVTSKQQYVLLHRHNVSEHLNFSLKRPGSLLSCCLCFTQHVRGRKFATLSAVKQLTQSFYRNLCPSVLISGLVQSSSSFSARARFSESVSISDSSNLFTSQNPLKKLYYSSKNRSFAYWR